MKKTIIYLCIATSSLWLQSCKSNNAGGDKKDVPAAEVPAAVTSTFAAKYPTAADVEWERETEDGKTVYEAEFKLDGKEKEAFIDESGNFLREKND